MTGFACHRPYRIGSSFSGWGVLFQAPQEDDALQDAYHTLQLLQVASTFRTPTTTVIPNTRWSVRQDWTFASYDLLRRNSIT